MALLDLHESIEELIPDASREDNSIRKLALQAYEMGYDDGVNDHSVEEDASYELFICRQALQRLEQHLLRTTSASVPETEKPMALIEATIGFLENR